VVTALADHIAAHALSGWPWACRCGGWSSEPEPGLPDRDTEQTFRAVHAAHVAESWAERRTIRTVEELAALPERVLVRDEFGEFFERSYTAWWSTADETGYGPEHITLPATVLYNPEEDQ